MSRDSDLNRRNFAAALAAATAAGCSGGKHSPFRFFTADEALTVEALTETLIPATPGAAGAKEAQVVHYIDRQLTRHLKKHKKAWREGLAKLDEAARSEGGKRFRELTPEQQTALLQKIEKGEVAESVWAKTQARPAFEIFLAHTIQGFYGSPRHGGNRDAVSWRMLGVPTIPVRGRLHYETRKEPS